MHGFCIRAMIKLYACELNLYGWLMHKSLIRYMHKLYIDIKLLCIEINLYEWLMHKCLSSMHKRYAQEITLCIQVKLLCIEVCTRDYPSHTS